MEISDTVVICASIGVVSIMIGLIICSIIVCFVKRSKITKGDVCIVIYSVISL